MTNVVIVIGGHTVSEYVIDVDTWGNKVTQIGTCTLVLDNTGDEWGGDFEPNDVITITIDATLIWRGFVDDVMPNLGTSGINVNEIIVKGRNHGRFLNDFQYTKNYKDQPSGEIIDDILDGVSSPLLYTDPGGTPNTKYNAQRSKLGTAFNDISSLVGYDYYIDTNGRIQYFSAGSSDSGVDLLSIVNGVSNNLLSFTEYESIGFDIKNVIKIHAGSVKDHWTDETASSWGNIVGVTTITDETTIFTQGTASLKLVASTNDVTFGLDFTGDLHGYTSLDMTRFGQAKVVFIPKSGSTGDFDVRPVLYDGNGASIKFTRQAANQGSKGFTENLGAFLYQWRILSFPIGFNSGTVVQTSAKSGWWHYTNRITISFAGAYTSAALLADNGSGQGTITADGGTPYSGLFIGETIELDNCEDALNDGEHVILSVSDTVITLTRPLQITNADDTTMDIITAFDWSNVVKLGFQLTTSPAMDTLYLDALYLPSVEAINSTTENGASIAAYGSRTLSEYRKQLRSQKELDDYADKVLAFRKDPIQKFKAIARGQTGTKYVSQRVDVRAPTLGINALTPYIIVSLQHSLHKNKNTRGWDYITKYDLVAQDTDPNRVVRGTNYFQAYLLQQARESYDQQGAITDDEYYLGDIETGVTNQFTSGTVQPTDANEGDRFYDTALNIEYEFTGGIWVPIVLSSAALEINLRPWTSTFSFIWDDKDDEPPVDFNHFKWGQLGNENAVDANIVFSAGAPDAINFGQDLNLGNGVWWVYWDDAIRTGGNFDVQFTQFYNNASGTGKGVLAQVFVDAATPDSPTVLMYNSYVPTIGAGSIVAHSIRSVHIDADFITGKNFQSVAGATSVTFTSNGILGKNAGVTQFSLSAATGKAIFAAGKAIIDTNGITINDTTGNILIFKDDAGAVTLGWLRTSGGQIRLEANGGAFLALDSPFAGDIFLGGFGEITLASPTDDILLQPGSGKDVIIKRQDAGHADPNFVPRTNVVSQIGEDGLMFAAVYASDYSATTNSDVDITSHGTGNINLNSDNRMTLDADSWINLKPTGQLRVNGIAGISVVRTWDDALAGVQHSVTTTKGIITSWTVT